MASFERYAVLAAREWRAGRKRPSVARESQPSELRAIYESGQGTLKLRGEWEVEEGARGAQTIVVTSIPYAQEKASLVSKIADVIIERRLPVLVDVRDESTDDVRIVLEIKRDTDKRVKVPQALVEEISRHTVRSHASWEEAKTRA